MRKHRILLSALSLLPYMAHAATYTVTNTADSGNGSLRWALNQANGNAGADTVAFNVGSGAKSIALASALPAITQALTLDATTQPGYAGAPLIELNGAAAGSGVSGLTVSASNAVIKGLVINRFTLHGILINAGSGTTVARCYIGTNAAGSGALANSRSGIFMANSGGHVIGPGNVVSGNGVDGVRFDAAGAANSVVKGNRIGTNAAGSGAVANGFNGVVLSNGAHDNVIGGTTAADLNVISGNTTNGVALASGATANVLARNFIGLAADGAAALGNGQDGVLLLDAPGNKVGGAVAGTFNIIAGNGKHGIEISASGNAGSSADGNLIQRNIVGSDLFGTLARGNAFDGINVNAAPGGGVANSVVGGGAWGAGGNLISANGGNGIALAYALHTLVQGNRIGTDVSGTSALGNGGNGISASSYSDYATIGAAGAGNLISGNHQNGVVLDASDSTIAANTIGTNAEGSARLGNANGVLVGTSASSYCYGDTIGGNWGSTGNLISGNGGAGVLVYCDATILGNRIGTDISGSARLGNNASGIQVASSASATIGSADHDAWTCNRACNLISGNSDNGVRAYSNGAGSAEMTVLGNFIGTNVAGTQALANSASGVAVARGTIGGSAAGAGNLISGNGGNGVVAIGIGYFDAVAIAGNRIGTAATGTSAIPNVLAGIRLTEASDATIGSGDRQVDACNASCNLISGNGGDGVYFNSGQYALDHSLQGNFIGTAAGGSTCLGNGGIGIRFDNYARLTVIGGPGAAQRNRIACNAGAGVALQSANNYLIDASPNEFFDNGGLAIDLGNAGVTANDPGDGDSGPNLLYNFPVLASATSGGAGSGTVITGTLASEGGNHYRIDYYSSPTCDASGHGEGRNFLGSKNVATDGAGNASINVTFATAVPVGSFVVTVSTEYGDGPPDGVGNSSEFSQCMPVTCTPPLAPAAGNGGPVCATQSLGLLASTVSGASYQWSGPNGFTSTAQNPTIANASAAASGTYSVRSSVNGCASAPATTLATVNACSLGIADASLAEGNSATAPMNFAVTLNHASTQPLTVQWATANGTASAPADYTSGSGTLTFSANQTSRTIAVNVVGDTLAEANETFKVSLSNASAGTISRAQAIGTIGDDDSAGTVQFSTATYSLAENGAGATITVTRSGGSASGVTVNYAATNGTALAGSDYTATSGTLTFGAGQTSRTFSVPIADDTIDEPDETVLLSLSAPAGGAALGTPSTATLTIGDNDAANGQLTMSECAAGISELLPQLVLSVARVNGSGGAVSVHYATANATASAGSDYTATSGTLSWAAGDTAAKTFSIAMIDNPLVEPPEAFNVVLSQPAGGATLGVQASTIVTILDDPDYLFGDGFEAAGACPAQ